VVTELWSPSLDTIGTESCLNIEKRPWSLHMACEAPESMTYFRVEMPPAAAAARASAQVVSQRGLQSLVVV